MCGIVGIVSPNTNLVQKHAITSMMQAIQHRGNDDDGCWINTQQTVAFGHQRLAIIDTSSAGKQPFSYLHYTLVFNGEIYNYKVLKATLQQKGYVFFTQTDTEVLAAAFDYWGQECLQQLDGMFAFAIYNNLSNELLIARDRFGEKPLYYYVEYEQKAVFKRFFFASEMKAIWQLGISKDLNGLMMLNYITLGYTQHPLKNTQTFYSNILSLPPGHCLTIQSLKGKVQLKRWYWFKPTQNIYKTVNEAAEYCNELFAQSVQQRLQADVPVGTSLSGGIDSSYIVATILQQQQSIHTFSAVFDGFNKNEKPYIDKVLQHCSNKEINAYFTTPTAIDWASNWSKLMHHQEEPVQSSSIFTQFAVYKLAHQQGVKVIIDGQGADEIAAGYTRYIPWHLQYLLKHQPTQFIKEKKWLQENGFLQHWNFKNYAAAFLPEKAAHQLQQKAIQQQLHHPHLHTDFYSKYYNDDTLQKPIVNSIDDLLYYDTFITGLQTLLRYADRNSMAFGVEVRLPFLQHQLVEFIFGLPPSYKIQMGFTKYIIRLAMQTLLPNSIVWRKGKIGYEPPQQQWMKEPAIIDIVHESRKKLVEKNILQSSVLQQPIQSLSAHEQGNIDFRYMSAAALL